jgi:hypothetical protein
VGQKQVRANTPNPKNTDIPANRLSSAGPKKYSKTSPKTTPKWWAKVRAKSRPGRRCQHRILVKQALAKTAFGGRIWRILKKGGQFPKNPMKQAISGAITNRKRTMKMEVKNHSKIDGREIHANGS